MCLSSGHGLMGAGSGYFSCLAIEVATQTEFSWWFPHIAAGVTAGWALWCDIDTLKATVTTSLGWITRGLHELVCWIAAGIYYATRTDADPPDKPKIHRGITHTWPGALFMGLLIFALCMIYPLVAVPIVLGVSLHWGMRGLAIPRDAHGTPKGNIAGRFVTKRAYVALRLVPQPGKIFAAMVKRLSRWLGLGGKWLRTLALGVCLLAAFAMCDRAPELHDWRYILFLGWLVVQGCLVHMVGDSMTESGICWKFPFKDKKTGKRWAETKIPAIVMPRGVPILAGRTYKPAFKTGRWFEIAILSPILLAACLVLAPGGLLLLIRMGVVPPAWQRTLDQMAALALPHG